MSRKAADTERAYPELEKRRAKLAEVMAKLKDLDRQIEEAVTLKREREARQDDILARAEMLLDGNKVLPERDLDSEIKALFEQRGIVAKALQIQQGRVDEAAREATSAEYRRLKPGYIAKIKMMVSGIETVEAALADMRAIRNEMTGAGLPDVFPLVIWPGLKPGDFQRQREAFQYKLELSGLGEALK